MSDPSTQAAQQARRELARYNSLYHTLYGAGYVEPTFDDIVDVYTDTKGFFTGTYRALFGESPDGERPVSDFLERSFLAVGEFATSALDEFEDNPAQTACCLINGILVLAGRDVQNATLELQLFVLEEEYVAWLRFFREVLLAIRSLHGGDPGVFEAVLSVLALDLSGQIRGAAERALVGPLIAALVSFEHAIQRIGNDVARKIATLSCVPLIRLWGTILNWLYGTTGGFIGRARGYCLRVLLAAQKAFVAATRHLGAGIDGALPAHDLYELRHIDFLIRIIDELLGARTLLATCRLFVSPDEVGEPDRIPPDAPGTPTSEDPDGDRGPVGGSSTPWFLENTDTDPLPAWTGIAEAPGHAGPGALYLTPANVAYLLAERFGYAPSEAVSTARAGACADDLSPETRRLLAELGL